MIHISDEELEEFATTGQWRCTPAEREHAIRRLLKEKRELTAPKQSDVGIKLDTGKDRWDLLPWASVRQVVQVLNFGAKKYTPDGWRKVEDPKRRYFAAVVRHLIAWQEGEKLDAESGLHHLAHAATNVIFLLALEES